MILFLDLGKPNISESLHCLANILADLLHCDKDNNLASSTDEIEDLGEDFIFNSDNRNHSIYTFISRTLMKHKMASREV